MKATQAQYPFGAGSVSVSGPVPGPFPCLKSQSPLVIALRRPGWDWDSLGAMQGQRNRAEKRSTSKRTSRTRCRVYCGLYVPWDESARGAYSVFQYYFTINSTLIKNNFWVLQIITKEQEYIYLLRLEMKNVKSHPAKVYELLNYLLLLFKLFLVAHLAVAYIRSRVKFALPFHILLVFFLLYCLHFYFLIWF